MGRPQPQKLETALINEECGNISGHVVVQYVSSKRRRCIAVQNTGVGRIGYQNQIT